MSANGSAFGTPWHGAGRLLSLGSHAAAMVRQGFAVWKNRRIVGELRSLDDYLLRDIGLTRGDVDSALAEPLYRDASWRLAERAMQTRRGDRARARDGQRWTALLRTAAVVPDETLPDAATQASRPRAA